MNEEEWIEVDIGDLVTMPVGVAYEQKEENGKHYIRNLTIISSVCNPAYLALLGLR